jgi:hypothetical protein
VGKENGKSELFPFRESKYYYYSNLHPKVEAVASIFVYFVLSGTEEYLRVVGGNETL